MIYRFANCELDLTRVVLRRDGEEVRVEPQAWDLLCYLVERRGEMVRKEELLDRVWGDRFVSESALTTQIKSVRRAVGDDGTAQSVIRTVHGKGYEFVADLTSDPTAPVDSERPANGRSPFPRQVYAANAPGQIAAYRLPAAVQSLIGREALLEILNAELKENRLVTLVGAGGVGKTSVAYELARRVAADFTDGVYPVELVTVLDEGSAYDAFATALDVSTRQNASLEDAIVDMLRPRRALLLIDNCEHLIEPVAQLADRTLRSAPYITILATSREPLAVHGEQVWMVDPLATDGGENATSYDLASVPAIALFVERARAADPRFELNASTAPAVVEICRRLDGIPLAIELAASRAHVIDVTEIASRLNERFRLLRGIRRGGDPRHRTLHDAISWSYDLLGDDEQRLFAALAVFAGPFDLAAAESMARGGDVLDLLTRLAERSMLVVRREPAGGTRYELLETMREYARASLDDNQSIEMFGAHASHFVDLAAHVATELNTPGEAAAVARGDAAYAEIRAAQRFALRIGDVDTACSLINSIREYAMRTLRYEVFRWAEEPGLLPEHQQHPWRALMTGIHAYGAWVRGEYATANDLARTARRAEEASGQPLSGLPERVLANVAYTLGRQDEGMVEAARQVEIAEDSGDASRLTHACYMYSVASSSTGAHEEADRMARRAMQSGTQTGSPTDLASAWVAEGFNANANDVAALEAFSAADRLARSAANRWMSAFARTEMSAMLVRRGELEEGCRGLADMLDLWYRAGEWSQQWPTFSRCLIALDRIGHLELAAEVVGAIEAHAAIGSPPSPKLFRDLAVETRDSLPARLGADRSEELRSIGAARPLAATVHRTRRALLGLPVED